MKKKLGRPSKKESSKRSVLVRTRISSDEFSEVSARARRDGLTVYQFTRDCILNKNTSIITPEEWGLIKALIENLAVLNRIANDNPNDKSLVKIFANLKSLQSKLTALIYDK